MFGLYLVRFRFPRLELGPELVLLLQVGELPLRLGDPDFVGAGLGALRSARVEGGPGFVRLDLPAPPVRLARRGRRLVSLCASRLRLDGLSVIGPILRLRRVPPSAGCLGQLLLLLGVYRPVIGSQRRGRGPLGLPLGIDRGEARAEPPLLGATRRTARPCSSSSTFRTNLAMKSRAVVCWGVLGCLRVAFHQGLFSCFVVCS